MGFSNQWLSTFTSHLIWYQKRNNVSLPTFCGKLSMIHPRGSWNFPLCYCIKSLLLQIWNNAMPSFLLVAELHSSLYHSFIVEFEDPQRSHFLSWLRWLLKIYLSTDNHGPHLSQNSLLTLYMQINYVLLQQPSDNLISTKSHWILWIPVPFQITKL